MFNPMMILSNGIFCTIAYLVLAIVTRKQSKNSPNGDVETKAAAAVTVTMGIGGIIASIVFAILSIWGLIFGYTLLKLILSLDN